MTTGRRRCRVSARSPTLRRRFSRLSLVGIGVLALLIAVVTTGNVLSSSYGVRAGVFRSAEEHSTDMLAAMLQLEIDIGTYDLTGDPSYALTYRRHAATTDDTLRALRSAAAGTDAAAQVEVVAAAAGRWRLWSEDVREQVTAFGQLSVPVSTLADGLPLFDAFRREQTRLDSILAADVRTTSSLAEAFSTLQLGAIVAGSAVVAGVLALTALRLRQLGLAPLERLAGAASRIAAGEHVAIPYAERPDEIGALAVALREWQVAAAERSVQLDRAAQIQRELLPRTTPDLAGYELAARCLPARYVAGDFYDWVSSDGYLDVTVADVMGKGLGAALVSATVRAALRTAPAELMPADRVQLAAQSLALGLEEEGLFVTLFHCRLDVITGAFRYVDAGHGYWAVRRSSGELVELSERSLPLGVAGDCDYREGMQTLEPGDTLLVCSDGLVELGEELGDRTRGLEEIAAGLAGAGDADQMVQRLVDGVEGRMPDDVTVVVLRRLPAAAAVLPLPASAGGLERVPTAI